MLSKIPLLRRIQLTILFMITMGLAAEETKNHCGGLVTSMKLYHKLSNAYITITNNTLHTNSNYYKNPGDDLDFYMIKRIDQNSDVQHRMFQQLLYCPKKKVFICYKGKSFVARKFLPKNLSQCLFFEQVIDRITGYLMYEIETTRRLKKEKKERIALQFTPTGKQFKSPIKFRHRHHQAAAILIFPTKKCKRAPSAIFCNHMEDLRGSRKHRLNESMRSVIEETCILNNNTN